MYRHEGDAPLRGSDDAYGRPRSSHTDGPDYAAEPRYPGPLKAALAGISHPINSFARAAGARALQAGGKEAAAQTQGFTAGNGADMATVTTDWPRASYAHKPPLPQQPASTTSSFSLHTSRAMEPNAYDGSMQPSVPSAAAYWMPGGGGGGSDYTSSTSRALQPPTPPASPPLSDVGSMMELSAFTEFVPASHPPGAPHDHQHQQPTRPLPAVAGGVRSTPGSPVRASAAPPSVEAAAAWAYAHHETKAAAAPQMPYASGSLPHSRASSRPPSRPPSYPTSPAKRGESYAGSFGGSLGASPVKSVAGASDAEQALALVSSLSVAKSTELLHAVASEVRYHP